MIRSYKKLKLSNIWVKIFLLALLCVVGGCRSTGSDLAKLNQVMQIDEQSMDLGALNLQIATTEVAIVSDLATNRTMVIKNGVVRDSFNTLSGFRDQSGITKSRTRLGVFTLHALDYCPPWYPSQGPSQEPCSEKNLLGEYGIWFDHYLYGIHGRPDSDYYQDFFDEAEAGDRNLTRGCLVASKENLQNLVDLLFELPSLKDHEGTKRIQQYREEGRKDNVTILFADELNYTPEAGVVKDSQVGGIAKVQARLLVIDTSHWQNNTPEVQAFVSVLKGDSTAQLVKDCLVKGSFRAQSEPSFTAGDLLVGVRANVAHAGQSIHFDYHGEGGMQQASFTPPLFADGDESQFDCRPQYYWSRQNRAYYISASLQPSSCLSEAVGVLFDQQTIFQTDLVKSTLESSKAHRTMMCMSWGGGVRGCSEKHACSIKWNSKESCTALYRLVFAGSNPPPYERIQSVCAL